MKEDILARIEQINKELEELERNEEKEMSKEEMLDRKIEEFMEMDEEQLDIYNSYRNLVKNGVPFYELFKDLGNKGFVEIVRVIVKGYVRDTFLNDNSMIIKDELENLTLMHIGLQHIAPEEVELDSFIYALVASAVANAMKGGE
jgi:hypothetical protein